MKEVFVYLPTYTDTPTQTQPLLVDAAWSMAGFFRLAFEGSLYNISKN